MKVGRLLLALALPSVAHADTAQDANALFANAQQRYEAGEYRAAIKLFEQAYQLVHDPVYLFNIAQSFRKLYDCVPSASYYERYLAEATDVDESQRGKVSQWLRELAPCVDEHKTKVMAPPIPVPAPVAPVPRAERGGGGYRVSGIVLVGVGAVGLAVGTVFGKRGRDLGSELAVECSTGCAWTAAQEREDRDGRRANLIAGISWIAGGAAIAGGVVLYVIGRSHTEHIQIAPTARGAAVSARFEF